MQNLNYQFLRNNKKGLKVNGKYKTWEIPIILSALHVVKQYRESQVKLSDYLTGPLAIYLTEKCNCSYFVRVYNENEYFGGKVIRQRSLIPNVFQIEIKKKIRTLKLENYYLLKTFIDSIEKSIYETYDYSMKLEKVRRDR